MCDCQAWFFTFVVFSPAVVGAFLVLGVLQQQQDGMTAARNIWDANDLSGGESGAIEF